MSELLGKVALVTGAATGIGQQIAVDLAKQGAKVIITGRKKESLLSCAALHDMIDAQVSDVSLPSDTSALVTYIENNYRQLDILVHNAGMAPVTPLAEQRLEELDAVFSINVRAVVHLTQLCLPLLTRSQGTIINISSAVASKPLANMSVYSASKAAMKALTISWSKELAAKQIRVNAISVGPIDTPIYEKTNLSEEEIMAHKQRVIAQIPLGKFGNTDHISSMVSYLASEHASFITGADIAVDGGFAN